MFQYPPHRYNASGATSKTHKGPRLLTWNIYAVHGTEECIQIDPEHKSGTSNVKFVASSEEMDPTDKSIDEIAFNVPFTPAKTITVEQFIKLIEEGGPYSVANPSNGLNSVTLAWIKQILHDLETDGYIAKDTAKSFGDKVTASCEVHNGSYFHA